MGLFSKETCILCGNEAGTLTRQKLDNGNYLCNECLRKAHISTGFTINALKASSPEQIKDRIEYVEKDLKENAERLSNFRPTTKIGSYIWFDDAHKYFVIPKGIFKSLITRSYVYMYDEIIDFEVLEDGTSITKGGFGKALIGGAVFGIAGAIAGGTSKKTKQICTKLDFKITTRNIDNPVIYINLINVECKKDTFTYKQAYKAVQDILSKFQIIIDKLEIESNVQKGTQSNNQISVADEIKKFKELLEIGVITQEEFDSKKSQLLGL